MTETPTGSIALHWNDELTSELLRFLTGRIKCADTAAEITHETYLRFHQFIQTHQPNNARALAYKIAINLANDYQRKAKVRSCYSAGADFDTLAVTHPSPRPEPEQIVIAQQQLERLQSALDELAEDCRSAFLLHSVHGLSYKQIAAQLHISEATVGRYLVKALSHSRQRLQSPE